MAEWFTALCLPHRRVLSGGGKRERELWDIIATDQWVPHLVRSCRGGGNLAKRLEVSPPLSRSNQRGGGALAKVTRGTLLRQDQGLIRYATGAFPLAFTQEDLFILYIIYFYYYIYLPFLNNCNYVTRQRSVQCTKGRVSVGSHVHNV